MLVDEDGDGTAERGLSGATVRIAGPGLNSAAVTGGSGGFAFDSLAAGSYTVSLALPGGVQALSGTTSTVAVDGKSAVQVQFLTARTKPAAQLAPQAAPQAPQPAPAPGSAPGAAGPSNPLSVAPPPAAAPTARVMPTPAPAPGSASSASAPSGSQQRGRASSVGPLVSASTRYYPGRAAPEMNKLIRKDGLVWLGVPFLTQLDGTAYGPVNCGPASTAMVLGTFGIRVSPAAVRDYVNSMSGVYNLAAGTSLEHLGRLVRESGLEVSNLYGPGGGFRRWSVDLLRQEVQAGHPVVTLVKYRALPSHAASVTEFDHYIVIAGLAGDDFIYNDAVYTNSSVGYGLVISPRDLERAWDYSSIPRHGMAVGLGAGRLAQQAAPEGEAPEGETEMAEGDVLADDVMLGAALEQRLNVDALSLKRVMIDGLTDAEYLIEPSFELAEFIDPAKVKLAGGEQAAPPALQPVAAPDPRPSLPPLALVPTALGLFALALIVRYRRALG